jgi:glycosyl transferase family 25
MNSLPSLFGATFLINLPERVDRLKSAKVQFVRAGWEIGPSGVEIFAALRYQEAAGFPNAATRGCFQSHLQSLRLAHGRRASSVLLVEDDIALSTALPNLMPSIKARLATQEWDFIYFGHYGTGNISSAGRETNADELVFDEWTGEILTTCFYGVRGQVLPRLIDHLDKHANGRTGDQEAGPMPIDGAYNIFRRNNRDIRCLIAHPKLGWQNSSRSDITPHALDKLPILRSARGLLRKLKQLSI